MKIKITWKIWLLISVVILSLLAMFGMPPVFLQKGVLITSVVENSTAFEQGLKQGRVIIQIDDFPISNAEDFSEVIQKKFPSQNKVKTIVRTTESEAILFSDIPPEITVSNIPSSRIKLGLDLSGGSRALIQVEDEKLTSSQTNDLADIIRNRLNVYGIADLNVRAVSDLSGEYFVLIEIAGATPSDLEKLISEQGKFEAKIQNKTVFFGGERDITSVSRSGQDAGIYSCSENQGGHFCNFRFSVYLSESAAENFAETTKNLSADPSDPSYLSDTIDFYLDGRLVDSLKISEGLKGRVTTQVSVSGSESGDSRDQAIDNANIEMKRLQTVLITGSLPYKLKISKLDTISPTLGKEFSRTIILAGIVALVSVLIIVFIRYRNLKSSVFLFFTSVSEIIIILGIASVIEWNLDLPSIAGILATIGTGIDDQIILLDETKKSIFLSIKQKIKKAFAIILGAYFTTLASLIPLYWAAAGLLKGFAITTIIGITVGVLITRPAFGDMIKGAGE